MIERTYVKPEIVFNEETSHSGIEIVNVAQFCRLVEKQPDWLSSLLTQAEMDYCAGKHERHAGRFAAKMALIKAMGVGLQWQEISILPSPTKRPEIQLTGKAAQLVQDNGFITLPLSISHDEGLAVALVIPTADNLKLQVGIDITSCERVGKLLERFPVLFRNKRFTKKEIDQSGNDPVQFAQKWAAKEATSKALGTGFGQEGVKWREIEIIGQDRGTYSVALSGNALAWAESESLHTWNLTIIPNVKTPIAVVIAHA